MKLKIFCYIIQAILVLYGAYCMAKSFGYSDEHVPLENEYMYQFSSTEWINPYLIKWQAPTNPDWKNPYTQQNPDWINPLTTTPNASAKQKAKWQKEFEFHHFQAKRTYDDAYNKSWYLPDLNWRQRAREAWIAAFSMVGVQTPSLKLVVVISSLLMQYGLDCMNEWEYIQEKLAWSEYHFKECEKYAQLLHGQ